MSNIIDQESQKQHKIEKFSFETLSESSQPSNNSDIFQEFTESDTLDEDSKTAPKKDKESASELLKKIENLTEENLKLQLQLESIQKELEESFAKEKETIYKEAKEEGIKEATQAMQDNQDELKTQMIKSITALDEKLFAQNNYLEKIKDELVDASIIIAKRVIKKELNENSHLVAFGIANSFLSDLKEATHIKIKVNPQDEAFLIEHLSDRKNIEIDPDDAINKGGIIILSDIGNIDGDIDTRIKKAISLIKQEG